MDGRTPWWRQAGTLVRELVTEMVLPPKPEPVLYLRCDACGRVAPRISERRQGGPGGATPPEYPCPLCGTFTPRVLGDQVDPNDPAVPKVTLACDERFGCLQFWRRCRCRTGFTVPAVAAAVMCPACGKQYPGPADPVTESIHGHHTTG